MFAMEIASDNVVMIRCGQEWTQDDAAAALGLEMSGRILVVDLSLLELQNGFTLVDVGGGVPFVALVLVCGTLENRIKIEMFTRLLALPCPVIPVMCFDEVAAVVTGLSLRESAGVIQ